MVLTPGIVSGSNFIRPRPSQCQLGFLEWFKWIFGRNLHGNLYRGSDSKLHGRYCIQMTRILSIFLLLTLPVLVAVSQSYVPVSQSLLVGQIVTTGHRRAGVELD